MRARVRRVAGLQVIGGTSARLYKGSAKSPREIAPPRPLLDRATYRERNRIERLVNRLKQSRRIATRHEKRVLHYLAMLTLAAVLRWI